MNIAGMYSLQRIPFTKPAQSCSFTYRLPCCTKSREFAFTRACTPQSGRRQLLRSDQWRCILCITVFGVKRKLSLYLIQIYGFYRSTKKKVNLAFTEHLQSVFKKKHRFTQETSINVSYIFSTHAYITQASFVILHNLIALEVYC